MVSGFNTKIDSDILAGANSVSYLAWYCGYTRESLQDFLIKAIRYGFGDRVMFGSDVMTWPSAFGLLIEYIINADFLNWLAIFMS